MDGSVVECQGPGPSVFDGVAQFDAIEPPLEVYLILLRLVAEFVPYGKRKPAKVAPSNAARCL